MINVHLSKGGLEPDFLGLKRRWALLVIGGVTAYDDVERLEFGAHVPAPDVGGDNAQVAAETVPQCEVLEGLRARPGYVVFEERTKGDAQAHPYVQVRKPRCRLS